MCVHTRDPEKSGFLVLGYPSWTQKVDRWYTTVKIEDMYTKPESVDIDPLDIPSPKILSSGRKIVTSEQRDFMVNLYRNRGLSTWKIGKVMGYLNVCVINNLRKAGVKLRNRSDANKTYRVNRDYFAKIDTPTKAYLLGLIYADGNIHKDSFTLALQEPDKYILEVIGKELGWNGTLNFRPRQRENRQDVWALRIYDHEFCSQLRQWGVIPRKTTQLKFPEFLDKSFAYDFIHGLLDGDGCIHISKKSQLFVSLAGAPQMTKDLQKLIADDLGIKTNRRTRDDSKGTVVFMTHRHAIGFLVRMYSRSKCPFFLTRKKNKFIDFLQGKINRHQIRKMNLIDIYEKALQDIT